MSPSRTPSSRRSRSRAFAATLAASALLLGGLAAAGSAAPGGKKPPKRSTVPVQVLSFNDFHGHLETPSGNNGVLGAD